VEREAKGEITLKFNDETEEKLRRYWIGKTSRVKKAVMEYIEGRYFDSDKFMTQNALAAKHGITQPSIQNHHSAIRKSGIINFDKTKECCIMYKYSKDVNPLFCVYCGRFWNEEKQR